MCALSASISQKSLMSPGEEGVLEQPNLPDRVMTEDRSPLRSKMSDSDSDIDSDKFVGRTSGWARADGAHAL